MKYHIVSSDTKVLSLIVIDEQYESLLYFFRLEKITWHTFGNVDLSNVYL